MKIAKLLVWYCFGCHQFYRIHKDDDDPPACCSAAEKEIAEAYECGACGELIDDHLDHRCIEDVLIPRCSDCGRPGQKLVSRNDTSWWCTWCHERLENVVTPDDLDDMYVGETIELPELPI